MRYQYVFTVVNGKNTTSAFHKSGADSIGHGGTCPHFYKWLGTGAP